MELQRTPGRSSFPGSFICYCLDISRFNPLDYDLLFERFIFQGLYPDIDIDIPKGYFSKIIIELQCRFPDNYFYRVATSSEEKLRKHECKLLWMNEAITANVELIDDELFYITENFKSDPFLLRHYDLLELVHLQQLQYMVQRTPDIKPHLLETNGYAVFELFRTGKIDHIFQFSYPSMQKYASRLHADSIED